MQLLKDTGITNATDRAPAGTHSAKIEKRESFLDTTAEKELALA
jgi:hypothetical protein